MTYKGMTVYAFQGGWCWYALDESLATSGFEWSLEEAKAAIESQDINNTFDAIMESWPVE